MLQTSIRRAFAFEEVESLNGCRHSLLSAEAIVFHPEDPRLARYPYWRYCKFIRKRHEQLDLLMLGQGQISVEEDAVSADVASLSGNFEACAWQHECYWHLQSEPMRDTPVLNQSSSSSCDEPTSEPGFSISGADKTGGSPPYLIAYYCICATCKDGLVSY